MMRQAKRAASLPYENATSGDRALAEMQRVLQNFGCESFGSMMDWASNKLIVQFRHHGRQVHIEASIQGYAVAWLRVHPWTSRMRATREAHEREAMRVASLACYSMLRDWLKGQIAAIETGLLSFDGAFLGQLMLPSGMTMLQHAQTAKMLPSGDGGSDAAG
jgi:hypothetical protein